MPKPAASPTPAPTAAPAAVSPQTARFLLGLLSGVTVQAGSPDFLATATAIAVAQAELAAVARADNPLPVEPAPDGTLTIGPRGSGPRPAGTDTPPD